MKDSFIAQAYAYYVINGRWPEAEEYIMKDPDSAYHYALNIVGRWPAAEPYIMQDPRSAYHYASNVIKGRWPEAESLIMRDDLGYKLAYCREFNINETTINV